MRMASLKEGDTVEVNVRGQKFKATIRSKNQGLLRIDPDDAGRITFRFARPHQIVKRIELPGRLG